MVKHKYCDVCFLILVSRECTTRCSYASWLLMHFKLRHAAKCEAFADVDGERHERHNSSSAGTACEDDEALSKETGVEQVKVTWCRNQIEEQMLMFVARDEKKLECARERWTKQINFDVGHNLGDILWSQSSLKFHHISPLS